MSQSAKVQWANQEAAKYHRQRNGKEPAATFDDLEMDCPSKQRDRLIDPSNAYVKLHQKHTMEKAIVFTVQTDRSWKDIPEGQCQECKYDARFYVHWGGLLFLLFFFFFFWLIWMLQVWRLMTHCQS